MNNMNFQTMEILQLHASLFKQGSFTNTTQQQELLSERTLNLTHQLV